MKNRNWVIVFVVLAILGLLAVGINWAYNAGEPLTPEKLKVAEDKWERNRPPNYDLKITVNKTYASSDGATGTQVDKYRLKVRSGQIVDFTLNGQPPQPVLDEKGERNLAREREIREGFDIDGLFDSIEEFMEMDRRDDRKTFIRARFDKTDGHVIQFTRQYQGRREQHIQVDLTRVKE